MDNDANMTSGNDSFGQTTVNMHAPTVDHLDLRDRDPTDMNKHVRVWFEEVLAEPEGMHSFDRVWRASYVTFTTVKFWCYRVCSLLCGVPFALCWGVYFACLTFLRVWYVVPCIKSCLIVLHWASKMWTICIRTFCDPCWESFGKIFSNIQLTNYRQWPATIILQSRHVVQYRNGLSAMVLTKAAIWHDASNIQNTTHTHTQGAWPLRISFRSLKKICIPEFMNGIYSLSSIRGKWNTIFPLNLIFQITFLNTILHFSLCSNVFLVLHTIFFVFVFVRTPMEVSHVFTAFGDFLDILTSLFVMLFSQYVWF